MVPRMYFAVRTSIVLSSKHPDIRIFCNYKQLRTTANKVWSHNVKNAMNFSDKTRGIRNHRDYYRTVSLSFYYRLFARSTVLKQILSTTNHSASSNPCIRVVHNLLSKVFNYFGACPSMIRVYCQLRDTPGNLLAAKSQKNRMLEDSFLPRVNRCLLNRWSPGYLAVFFAFDTEKNSGNKLLRRLMGRYTMLLPELQYGLCSFSSVKNSASRYLAAYLYYMRPPNSIEKWISAFISFHFLGSLNWTVSTPTFR